MDTPRHSFAVLHILTAIACVFCLLFRAEPVIAEEAPEPTLSVTEANRLFDVPMNYEEPPAFTPELLTLERIQPVVVSELDWWVTENDQTDALGNAVTAMNFLIYRFEDEVEWIRDNYTDGWPFGTVNDSVSPMYISPVIAEAIVANTWRECMCTPGTIQGGGWDVASMSASELLKKLEGLGTTNGKAWGIIQWDGGRRLNFVKFCKASGFDPRSLEVQLHYLAYEAYCSLEHPYYMTLLSRYNSATLCLDNVISCAETYRILVERGGTRGITERILRNWDNRWNYSWGDKPSTGLYVHLTMNLIEGSG